MVTSVSTAASHADYKEVSAISANLANRNTPGFELIQVDFAPGDPARGNELGVHVSAIERTPSFSGQFAAVAPGSDADLADGLADGLGPLPDISYERAMVDGIEALRAYEANIQAIDTTRSMIDSAIRVLA